ncbi:sensor domain-containing diguanylate cyclase [Actinoplanes sp. NPDC026619]|uniref:sensor domain-containing diguanylate cyclase n=1 Tax=Actinoplanes sp. NPDC026619 TaxID=3155798 RepID=UPI00340D158A
MLTRLDPVLSALVALSILMIPWFLFAPGIDQALWILQTAIDLINVAMAWRLYRQPGTDRYARRFWIAVAAAMGFSAMADAYQTALVLGGHPANDVSVVQSGLVVAGMVIAVITMLFHPLGGTGRLRLRLWLDAATVLTAVAVFLWYFLLAGEFSGGQTANRLAAAATSAVMLLVTFALIKLLFSTNAPFQQLPGMIGALGVTGTAVAAPLAALLMERSDTRLIYLAQLVPCLFIPISLRIQEILNRRKIDVPLAARRRRFSRMPYAAVVGTQLLLLLALSQVVADLKIWGVAAGVLLSTGLVLVRQQAAFHDNERLLAEISRRDEWFGALAQHASDTTVVTNGSQRVTYASPSAVRLLGLQDGDDTGNDLGGRIHAEDMPLVAELFTRMQAEGTAGAEVRLLHADGTYHWTHVVGTDLLANPNIRGLVWNGRDVTEARQLQDELRHQATHDVLTGLANRHLLQQRMLTVEADLPVSILVIDLDGFKQVNDVHGHHSGDQVLIAVAERLTGIVGDAGTVARLGGDEFAVILPDTDTDRGETLAAVLSRVVAEPIPVTGAVVTVGASIGVSSGTPAEAERMLREADDAMYRRKQSRRNLIGNHG